MFKKTDNSSSEKTRTLYEDDDTSYLDDFIELFQPISTNVTELLEYIQENPLSTTLFISGFIILILIITIVLVSVLPKKDNGLGTCDSGSSDDGGGGTTPTRVIDKTMVTESIVETTKLNNSYMVLYDNKNVDYRHSYYANLNVTTMQSWYPYLNTLYYFFVGIYAVFLLIFQRNTPWLSKVTSFVFVLIVTNVYILKFIVSLLIVCYTWLTVNLPKVFFYKT